ncbi:DUF2510 domain-containing protein [Streptomyces sp. NRRL F-5135]|uniref:DUF2510 domain-containing protein n=1 Tax=Streptomyces sp. NRRL F-5135 TaxID=1463858 RepID=UPI0004CA9755|nr:DUF2510 domain-containing protein [Streptomyces sp. NRRL F-5135]
MTHTTPPGWYPDPGHSGDGPRQERWWDGSVWTDELRASAPAASAAWGPPAPPPYPPSPPGSPGGRGRRVAVGVIASVVVLAVAGGFYLLGQGTDGNGPAAEARSGASAAPSRPGQEGQAPDGGQREPGGPDGEGDSPGQPRTEEGYATDAASGIAIPVPDGWKGESGPVGAGVTTGTYACPGETSQQCVRGGVFSAPAAALKIKGATAKAAAEQDIEANAEESYGGDTYGEISSHEELKAEEVTVAGQKGYLVRWKVVTAKGDDGYVQSLAFPSPATPRLMVVVRSGFDVNDKAPELSVMDEITRGIKAAAGGGGSGRDV